VTRFAYEAGMVPDKAVPDTSSASCPLQAGCAGTWTNAPWPANPRRTPLCTTRGGPASAMRSQHPHVSHEPKRNVNAVVMAVVTVSGLPSRMPHGFRGVAWHDAPSFPKQLCYSSMSLRWRLPTHPPFPRRRAYQSSACLTRTGHILSGPGDNQGTAPVRVAARRQPGGGLSPGCTRAPWLGAKIPGLSVAARATPGADVAPLRRRVYSARDPRLMLGTPAEIAPAVTRPAILAAPPVITRGQ
jgi:hypothetical protein